MPCVSRGQTSPILSPSAQGWAPTSSAQGPASVTRARTSHLPPLGAPHPPEDFLPGCSALQNGGIFQLSHREPCSCFYFLFYSNVQQITLQIKKKKKPRTSKRLKHLKCYKTDSSVALLRPCMYLAFYLWSVSVWC